MGIGLTGDFEMNNSASAWEKLTAVIDYELVPALLDALGIAYVTHRQNGNEREEEETGAILARVLAIMPKDNLEASNRYLQRRFGFSVQIHTVNDKDALAQVQAMLKNKGLP